MVLAVNLINGPKDVRDSFINKTEVLDKVKKLVMLPDNKFMTLRQLADYYEIDIEVVRKTLQRHRAELESDGMVKLKGKSLSEYKQKLPYSVPELRKVPSTQLLPRRAILRMGMLLKNSKVAEKVRTYLLEAEEMITDDQRDIIFQGRWTDEIDQYILETVANNEKKGIRLNDTIQQLAGEIHASVYQIKNYWYIGGQGKEPLRNRLKSVTQKEVPTNDDCSYNLFTITERQENKTTEELLSEQINQNKQLFSELQTLKETNQQIMTYVKSLHTVVIERVSKEEQIIQEHKRLKAMIEELYEVAIKNNQEKIECLEKEIKKLNRKLDDTEREYEDLKNDMDELVRRAGVSILLGETGLNFRMEQNSNLERYKK